MLGGSHDPAVHTSLFPVKGEASPGILTKTQVIQNVAPEMSAEQGRLHLKDGVRWRARGFSWLFHKLVRRHKSWMSPRNQFVGVVHLFNYRVSINQNQK